MSAHYVPTSHPVSDSLQLLAHMPEPVYSTSIEPSYSREMYAMSDMHQRRPNNLDCGYINDYQSRDSPVCESPGMAPLYDVPSDTPIQSEYLDPDICEGLSRSLNIHKSFHTNPNKISQSRSLQKAQRDLDWKLKSRSTLEDLISKGILLGRVEQSPNILQSRIRLERAKTSDILKKKILARPPKGKLIDGNILKEFSGSPRLQQSQMSILKQQKMQRLNEKISERPGAQLLIKRGILCPPAPSLNECLQQLQNPINPDGMRPIVRRGMRAHDSMEQFTAGNQDVYPPNLSAQSSPSSISAHSQGCEMSRERPDHLRHEGANLHDLDCTIVEDTDLHNTNSALDQFTVYSKFERQEDPEIGFKRSLSKKISIRNPPNESPLKKDLSSSSSLKTRSGKRPRKGIKTYKYHEYIPCNNSSNGLTKCKILEKTQLTKTALTESKGRNKTSVDMEVQQDQLLLQLHLLRQQYPSLMPGIYNQLVTQLSQIDGKAEGVPKRSYTLEEIESMTVTSLKALCKENSVPSTGKKAELVMRLRDCKGLVIDKVELVDVSGRQEVAKKIDYDLSVISSKQELVGHSPGSKSVDEPVKQAHSPNTHASEVAQEINAVIASPPSVLSQYSGASSDSYVSENCSSAGKAAGYTHNVQRPENEDQHYSNEFDCVPGIDAVKYLDDSMCHIRNPQIIGDNSFDSATQIYKHPGHHNLSSSTSLPSIPAYHIKAPHLHSPSKLGITNMSADNSEMSDLLQQLDSFDNYDMNLNRSTGTYQPRPNNTQFPYSEPYYGDIQGVYSDKPMGYPHDTHSFIDLPYTDDISCPSSYPLDMSMDWNTPNMANDPYTLNEYSNYDVTHMGLEGIGRNASLQNSLLFHNSMNNSIEQDFLQ